MDIKIIQKPKPPVPELKLGQMFYNNECYFILALVGYEKYSLVGLDGNRWTSEPKGSLVDAFNGFRRSFTLVEPGTVLEITV